MVVLFLNYLVFRVLPYRDFASRYQWAELLEYLNLKLPKCLSLVHYKQTTLPNGLYCTHHIVFASLLSHGYFKQEKVVAWVFWERRPLISTQRVTLSFLIDPGLDELGTFQ